MDNSQEIFSASTSDVRPLATILRCLLFRKKAVVSIRADGIKVTVEEGRSIQANAYLQAHSFKHYDYNPPPSASRQITPNDDDDEAEQDEDPEKEIISAFQISLSTLMECFNIFGNAGGNSALAKNDRDRDEDRDAGGSKYRRFSKDGGEREGEGTSNGKVTSLRMSYSGYGTPLILLLEEEGIVTRCEITTYEPEALMDLTFHDDEKVQRLIMKSEWLRDAFLEIDPTSEKITMTFSPADYNPTPYNRYAKLTAGKKRRIGEEPVEDEATPTFRLESIGILGSTEMDYPNDRDVLEVFECEHLCRNSYKFSHIQHTTKALIASTKTSIRTNAEGLLSFQFMIQLGRGKGANGESKDAFVEFICVALDE